MCNHYLIIVLGFLAVRGEWVAVLKELCSNSDTRLGGDSCDEKQGYLEMNGFRSKLFIVVSTDRVFLYMNSEVLVCTLISTPPLL